MASKVEHSTADTVQLQHEHSTADTVLVIGTTEYRVTGGVVAVAPEHVGAAMLAGFRPA